jgi:hypothetical protein
MSDLMEQRLLWPIIASVVALGSGCFQPALECTRCSLETRRCPGNLTCNDDGWCVDLAGGGICEEAVETDAARDTVADGGARDGTASPDVMTLASPDAPSPPACTERCCVGAMCLDFPPRLQRGLLLWADRTSLPSPGQLVSRWRDRSSHRNDILAVNPKTPPRVQRDEVGPIVEIDDPGMVLATEAGPGLTLGIEDFTLFVLARCDAPTFQGALFDKINTERMDRAGVELHCNSPAVDVFPGTTMLPPTRMHLAIVDDARFPIGKAIASQDMFAPGVLHLVAARRVDGTTVQLRVDGVVQGQMTIPASVNINEQSRAFVGSHYSTLPTPMTFFNGGLGAVIVVRGPLGEDEFGALEAFLLRTLASGATPL